MLLQLLFHLLRSHFLLVQEAACDLLRAHALLLIRALCDKVGDLVADEPESRATLMPRRVYFLVLFVQHSGHLIILQHRHGWACVLFEGRRHQLFSIALALEILLARLLVQTVRFVKVQYLFS